jgi:hypothetical protein
MSGWIWVGWTHILTLASWTFSDHVRFQVLTAASMMFRIVFWDVLPCKIIVYRRFRRAYCLHPHPWCWRQYAPLKRRSTIILHGITSQKTILNMFLSVMNTHPFNSASSPVPPAKSSIFLTEPRESLGCMKCLPDETLTQIKPHTHRGCVRLFLFPCGTSHKYGCQLNPVWRAALVSGSVLLTGLLRVLSGICWVLETKVFLAERLQRNLFHIFVLWRTASIPGALNTSSLWWPTLQQSQRW